MERWFGRVALVTGASEGIGAAIAKELVRRGMKVVGIAPIVDNMEAMVAELKNAPGKLYPMKGDVTQEENIVAIFDWIVKNLGGVDVLINNAGIGRVDAHLVGGNIQSYRGIFNVNVIGLSICTNFAIKSMRERGVDDGHIIHINSVSGHKMIDYPGMNLGMYSASKHGVTTLTEALRQELVHLKSRIRVTSISPGAVKTNFIAAASFFPNSDEAYDAIPHLNPEDIVESVLFVLGAPPHVQIHEMIIKPVGEEQ